MQQVLQKIVKEHVYAPDSGPCLWVIFDFGKEQFSGSSARQVEVEIELLYG
jgi:hypothetical protein